MKHLVFICFCILSCTTYSQAFKDGKYTLTDGDHYTLDINVCDNGLYLCSFIFKHDENVITYSENGAWEFINSGTENSPSGLYMIDEGDESYRITHISGAKYRVVRNETEYIMEIQE